MHWSAFRFLSWLAQGQKLSVLKHRVDDSEEVLRGQVSSFGFLGSTIIKLGCQTEADDDWKCKELQGNDGHLHY
ncbi:hypothetical protein [Pseudomonas sp.]